MRRREIPTEPVLSVRFPFQPLSIRQISTTPMVRRRTNYQDSLLTELQVVRNNNYLRDQCEALVRQDDGLVDQEENFSGNKTQAIVAAQIEEELVRQGRFHFKTAADTNTSADSHSMSRMEW